MLNVERVSVMNLENAMRGARNPMNSWARSDSGYNGQGEYVLGENDLDLAARLCASGSDHRKFIRQIFVSMDITAPLYWWKEFDTYKIGTVANSTSTMHKLHARPLEPGDFSTDHLTPASMAEFRRYIAYLETVRQRFVADGNRADWYDLIQLLPASYNQLRTVTLNYEVLANIYYARRNHKLEEWHVLCAAILELPYARRLLGRGAGAGGGAMSMEYRAIDLERWPRREHFAYFSAMADPYVGVTAEADITDFLSAIRGAGLPFFLSFLYCAGRAGNAVPQLRQRIVDGAPVEFARCDTSHTVLREDGTYSYCRLDCMQPFEQYLPAAQALQEQARERGGLDDGEDAASLFFVSTLPFRHSPPPPPPAGPHPRGQQPPPHLGPVLGAGGPGVHAGDGAV